MHISPFYVFYGHDPYFLLEIHTIITKPKYKWHIQLVDFMRYQQSLFWWTIGQNLPISKPLELNLAILSYFYGTDLHRTSCGTEAP